MKLFPGIRGTTSIGLALALGLHIAIAQVTEVEKARSASMRKALNEIAQVAEHSNQRVIVELRTSGQYMLPDPITIRTTATTHDPVGTLNAMLAGDARFHVLTDPDGVIRISDSRVDEGLLNLRIRHVALTKLERYNPDIAMQAVLDSPEVKAYFEKRRIAESIDIGGLMSPTDPKYPHLERALDKMTLLEILKHMLALFSHTAIYNECVDDSGKRFVAFGFWDAD